MILSEPRYKTADSKDHDQPAYLLLAYANLLVCVQSALLPLKEEIYIFFIIIIVLHF